MPKKTILFFTLGNCLHFSLSVNVYLIVFISKFPQLTPKYPLELNCPNQDLLQDRVLHLVTALSCVSTCHNPLSTRLSKHATAGCVWLLLCRHSACSPSHFVRTEVGVGG